MANTFDGVNKLITIDSAAPNVSVKELYSEWKEWSLLGSNLGYAQAFRAFGGDPTVAGQFAPAYFFLTNGWRIVVDGFDAIFATNLYTEEGALPVITLNNGTAQINNSDAPQVSTTGGSVDVNAIASAVWGKSVGTPAAGSYGEAVHHIDYLEHSVWLDTEASTNGNGSMHSPFSVVNDAIDYMEGKNIRRLYVLSDTEINRQIKNFIVTGIGTPRVEFLGVHSVKGSEFSHVSLSGAYTDVMTAQECVLEDGFLLRGFFENCGLAGNLTATGQTLVKDCASMVAGTGRPTITVDDGQLSLRGYSGGMTIKGMSLGTDTVTAEIATGSLTFDATNTGGEMVARGVCKFVDQTAGATVVDETIKPETVQRMADIVEADEVYTGTKATKYKRGTNLKLVEKTVTGGSTQNISLTE